VSMSAPSGCPRVLTPSQAIVLAAMGREPCYGYAVVTRVMAAADESIPYPLTASAIYYTLSRLQEQGHIAMLQPGVDGPRRLTKRRWDDRRWYCLTPGGGLAFSRWIADPRFLTDVRAHLEGAVRRGAPALHDALDHSEALCSARERALAVVQVLCTTSGGDPAVIARQRSELCELRQQMRSARAHIDTCRRRLGANRAAEPPMSRRLRRPAGPGRPQAAVVRGG
jgi:DNA-binding PadR family transcriptional regulator